MNRFLAILILTAAAVAAPAADQKRMFFNIPAQQLSTALLKFSEQSQIQITAPSQLVADLHTEGVHGELGPGQALKQMLLGSGLSFEFISDGSVAIRPASAANQVTEVPQGPDRSALNISLAQAEENKDKKED